MSKKSTKLKDIEVLCYGEVMKNVGRGFFECSCGNEVKVRIKKMKVRRSLHRV